MTAQEFYRLCDSNPAEASRLIQRLHHNGRAVNVEREALPTNASEIELHVWIGQNVTDAIALNDDGGRPYGIDAAGRWTWVYRIVHGDGAITILKATAPN